MTQGTDNRGQMRPAQRPTVQGQRRAAGMPTDAASTQQHTKSAPAAANASPQRADAAPAAKSASSGVRASNVVLVGQQKPHKGRTIIIAVIAVLAAAAIGVGVFLGVGGGQVFDPSAQSGQAPYKSAEEIQAELNRVVQEGMFNIAIASQIVFEDGTSEGTAYIENIPANHYNMQVTITSDDTGEVLYESGLIKPDQFIEKIKLNKDLDPGSYGTTAVFTAYDQETGEKIGQAAAKVSIVVIG